VSTKFFAGVFDWINDNVPQDGSQLRTRRKKVENKWERIVTAIVHPDSTIAYYYVHDGIHKPLEGVAGT
jgi:hypothetical protein